MNDDDDDDVENDFEEESHLKAKIENLSVHLLHGFFSLYFPDTIKYSHFLPIANLWFHYYAA